MSRLADDIALLERAATIAGQAIWPEAANVSVPPATLEQLGQAIAQRAASPADYRLIDDEAVWLMQAAKRVALERLDGNEPKIQRWTCLAELLRASIALDLVNAKKSAGEVG
jgi:hypothetical protein